MINQLIKEVNKKRFSLPPRRGYFQSPLEGEKVWMGVAKQLMPLQIKQTLGHALVLSSILACRFFTLSQTLSPPQGWDYSEP